MNREIKFRAWDKHDNLMKRVISVREDSIEVPLPRFPFVECIYDYVLMQYTGQKDKNGKEIYEGDILKVNTQKGFQNHSVEWVDFSNYVGYRMYGTNRRWNVPLTKNRVYNGKIEVIGNIYENFELLNN